MATPGGIFICREGSAVEGESEAVLLLLQGKSPMDHPGVVDGFERLRVKGAVRSLDVIPVFGPAGAVRGDAFWGEVIKIARDKDVSLVVFQNYHAPHLPDPRGAINELMRLPSRPIIVSTLGDPFMNGYLGRPHVPRSFLHAASVSNLVTLTSMGLLADHIARYTNAPIILMPHGACQVRFGKKAPATSDESKEFDVAFVGSRNRSRNPGKGYFWLGRRRQRLVERLASRYGRRFAVFGNGWNYLPSALGPVPFTSQVDAIRRARVVVGGIPFSRARYYASDRPFIQATSGIPMVDVPVPGVDTLLRNGSHWVLVDELMLLKRIDEILDWSESDRHGLGATAAEYVLERHTQAHRVEALMENVKRIRRNRDGKARVPLPPYLPFLLDDVDTQREEHLATRNWHRA